MTQIDWTKPIEINRNNTGKWCPARLLGVVKDLDGGTHVVAAPSTNGSSETLVRTTVEGIAGGFQFVRNKPEEIYVNLWGVDGKTVVSGRRVYSSPEEAREAQNNPYKNYLGVHKLVPVS